MASKRRIWEMFAAAPPPLGYDLKMIWDSVDSPDFGVLKFTPWRIELFDAANKENMRTVWRR